MKKIIFLFIVATLTIHCFSQTYSIVTENYCRLNFVPKTGVTPGTDNFKALSCDEILARYNVSITGSTITGNRCPSQNQLTASLVCPVVGDTFGGGVVAYVYQPGDAGYVAGECHGIIFSSSDISSAAGWGCGGTSISGADGIVLGTGSQNTIDILAECSMPGIAAKLCSDYTNDGYSDWFLPSKDELHKLYIYYHTTGLGGFANDWYWSSSEYNSLSAYVQDFTDSTNGPRLKISGVHVRAVRYF